MTMQRTRFIKTERALKQAIHLFCTQCVGNRSGNIPDCKGVMMYGKPCNFYKYRLGKGRPSIQHIRKECLRCMGYSNQSIADCNTRDCPLYLYRFGTNFMIGLV